MIRQVNKYSRIIYSKEFKITHKDFEDIKFPKLTVKQINIFKLFFPRYLFINVHATWRGARATARDLHRRPDARRHCHRRSARRSRADPVPAPHGWVRGRGAGESASALSSHPQVDGSGSCHGGGSGWPSLAGRV